MVRATSPLEVSPYLTERPRSLASVQAERLVFRMERFGGDSQTLYVTTEDEWDVADIEIDSPHDKRAEFKAEFSKGKMRPHYFPAIHRRVKHMIADAHMNGVVRVWCAIDAGDDKGHRWLRALGFEPEGLMRQYAKGRDFVMYAHLSQACGR